jgi:hypothetical protein
MPGLIASTQAQSGVLALGAQATFIDTYRRENAALLEGPLSLIVQDAPALSDAVKFAYWQSPPIANFWARGRPKMQKAMKDVGWTVVVKDWSQQIRWKFQDAMDDQTGSLVSMAQGAGQSFPARDESNWFQLMNAGTDVFGLDALPNASDGAALFSATDGGSAARFGVTGGNIVTGISFGSGAGVRAGFFAILQRMAQFQDTEGQPLLNPGSKRFLVFGAAADMQVLAEAFFQNPAAQAATTATSNAATQNLVLAAGLSVNVQWTQRIATGVMYVFCLDVPVKPLIRARRMDPAETWVDKNNSDECRNLGLEGFDYVSRTGYGISLGYGAVKGTT